MDLFSNLNLHTLPMVLAIWKRSLYDAFWLLAGCVAVMFGFLWLFVYTTSFVSTSAFVNFMADLPDQTQGMFGISIRDAASWPGRLALAFVDPTVVIISAIWAIARGSDAVSGPLDRGTMEMVLAQPVSRLNVLTAHSAVTILGAALLAVAAWLGLWVGISLVHVERPRLFFFTEVVPLHTLVQPACYAHGALNLFSLTVLTAGIATLVSACGRYRRQTIGIVGGFYVIQIILKVAGLAAEELSWLFRFTIFGLYWPQVISVEAMKDAPNDLWSLSLRYNGLLLGGAVVCYVAAAVIFNDRDLPAPM